eukprot:CAMPEP_0194763856 /NCGR_PEP_ID=MMETSP0323_2-20130528/20652_1 /TAXON_ID=2866 ORGANISM="Crypthecodinium cohnii, Strain Seligo" /NCGR_SAMPLE_ID=MMETSP0323_2 /ASSEMBLY_ACC=CAM_ASM_000346 /LENGTH=38 /DNA_ID= /DNA_START= /DNA_END= /DNA_ORIENTATION=
MSEWSGHWPTDNSIGKGVQGSTKSCRDENAVANALRKS